MGDEEEAPPAAAEGEGEAPAEEAAPTEEKAPSKTGSIAKSNASNTPGNVTLTADLKFYAYTHSIKFVLRMLIARKHAAMNLWNELPIFVYHITF